MDGEHVGLLDGARIDALGRLHRRQRREAVAIDRGALEFEIGGRLLHFGGEFAPDRAAAAGQKGDRFADQLGVAGEIDLVRTRRGATLDLVEQARPRPAFEKGIGAGAHQERPLQRRDGTVHRAGRGERAEITSGPGLGAAMLDDLRRPVVAGDEDIGKRLVVAELHVEARPQLLDEVGLEQQRLGLGAGGDDFDPRGGRDHPRGAGDMPGGPHIGGQPLADVLGLADVKHVVGRIEHPVDARRVRRVPHHLGDHRPPGGQRHIRNRAVLFGFGGFRQRGLVLLLDASGLGIDVECRRGRDTAHRAIRPGSGPRALVGCALAGHVAGIVPHGPKLGAPRRPRQPARRAGPVTLR